MKDDKKNILIFMCARLGDCILFIPTLKEIQKIYSLAAGYQIFLICRSPMKDFYEKYLGCNEIEYIETNIMNIRDIRKHMVEFYKLFRGLKRRRYEKVIVAAFKRFNYYGALCIRAKEKYLVAYQAIFHRLYKVEQYLILNNFEHIVMKHEGYFIANTYRDLIRILGEENYLSCIPKINMSKLRKPKDIIVASPYVVIAPYGSILTRRIPKDMLTAIISYLLRKTKMDVYVVGVDKDRENHLLDTFIGNERVKNEIGLTTLDQLVSKVHNSNFVIAVDTGVTHLAAALGVKNICIVGNWGRGQFLPYDYDEKEGKEYFPRCVFPVEQFECKNCDFIASRGKTNVKCRENVESGKSLLCLEQIDINDVYREIDILLKENEENHDA